MVRNKKVAKKRRKRFHFRRFILFIILFVVLIFGSIITYIMMGVHNEKYGEFPDYETLRKIEHAQATEVFTSDGKIMGRYFHVNRNNLAYDDIPGDVLNALVATEDVRFYEHNGIDIRSLFRVLFKTVLLGDRSSGGGSTITQQLAKNLYPRKGKGTMAIIGAKIREMIVATRIEKLYNKNKILQLYVNTVPFGENTYGVKNASLLYFGKEPQHLSLNQSAVLIGMLKATSTYNPHRYPEKSLSRRNTVLSQMVKYNYIPPQIADSLKKLPLHTNYHPIDHNNGIAPYFREFLRKELEIWCANHHKPDGNPYNLYTDGLKIYTTIHSGVQEAAREAILSHMPVLQKHFNRELRSPDQQKELDHIAREILKKQISKTPKRKNQEPELKMKAKPMEIFSWEGPQTVKMTALDSIKHYISFLQTGFVSLNPRNGQVLAWIGGINHQFFKYDHVLSKRQAGSVFKPVVYLKALENDVEPCDYYANDSVVYEDFENWTPANADKQFGGVYSVQGALINSVNTIAVKLLMEAGIDSVIHLAKEMGIESDMPKVPSLGLGTAQVSVLEIALAYSILANEGRKVQPNFLLRIEDKNGHVIKRFGNDQKGKRVITEEIREKMTMMLQGVAERGTARSISENYSIPGDVAGKTGTTQNHSDGWFVGYTPNLVFASWVGADYPGIHFQSLRYGQGAYTALPISAKFLVNLSNDSNSKEYFGRFAYNSINPSDYNCEDYREKAPGFIEKIFDKEIFQKESGKKKDKKGILKKIIGLFKKDKKDTIHAE